MYARVVGPGIERKTSGKSRDPHHQNGAGTRLPNVRHYRKSADRRRRRPEGPRLLCRRSRHARERAPIGSVHKRQLPDIDRRTFWTAIAHGKWPGDRHDRGFAR